MRKKQRVEVALESKVSSTLKQSGTNDAANAWAPVAHRGAIDAPSQIVAAIGLPHALNRGRDAGFCSRCEMIRAQARQLRPPGSWGPRGRFGANFCPNWRGCGPLAFWTSLTALIHWVLEVERTVRMWRSLGFGCQDGTPGLPLSPGIVLTTACHALLRCCRCLACHTHGFLAG